MSSNNDRQYMLNVLQFSVIIDYAVLMNLTRNQMPFAFMDSLLISYTVYVIFKQPVFPYRRFSLAL